VFTPAINALSDYWRIQMILREGDTNDLAVARKGGSKELQEM